MSQNQSTLFLAFDRYTANRADVSAREQVLQAVSERMDNLARTMLHSNRRVARWDQTQDIAQMARVKLWKALGEAEITDLRHLLNIAAMHIRNTLKDQYRKYDGAEGIGHNHFSEGRLGQSVQSDCQLSPLATAGEYDEGIESLELHELVERLPAEERETFDLLYYNGMSQVEAAATLGVAEKTIQRRWRRARLALAELLGVELTDC